MKELNETEKRIIQAVEKRNKEVISSWHKWLPLVTALLIGCSIQAPKPSMEQSGYPKNQKQDITEKDAIEEAKIDADLEIPDIRTDARRPKDIKQDKTKETEDEQELDSKEVADLEKDLEFDGTELDSKEIAETFEEISDIHEVTQEVNDISSSEGILDAEEIPQEECIFSEYLSLWKFPMAIGDKVEIFDNCTFLYVADFKKEIQWANIQLLDLNDEIIKNFNLFGTDEQTFNFKEKTCHLKIADGWQWPVQTIKVEFKTDL